MSILDARLLAVGVCLISFASARQAWSCSCASGLPSDDKGRRQRYGIAFWGTAKSLDCVDPEAEKLVALGLPSCREYQSEFRVDAVWKGRVAAQVIVRPGRGSCGVPFEPGRTYLVFAQAVTRDGREVATNLCTGSHASSLEEARRSLGKAQRHLQHRVMKEHGVR